MTLTTMLVFLGVKVDLEEKTSDIRENKAKTIIKFLGEYHIVRGLICNYCSVNCPKFYPIRKRRNR